MPEDKQPGLGNKAVKAAAKAPFQAIKSVAISTVKSGLQKINPLDKKINTNDASETGVESLRFGYTSAKQAKNTVKTTVQTIKTTKRTIKTTGEVAKETGKTVIRVTKTTVKTVVKIGKVIADVAARIAASLSPTVLVVIAAVIMMLVLLAGVIVMIIGSTSGASNNIRHAYENAEGLADPATGYADGLEFYKTAIHSAQNAFNAQIDALVYDTDDLKNSDLVYYERTSPGNSDAKLSRSELASDSIKQQIKDTWLPCLSENEVLAITYVYLQKEQNDANGTDAALYMVEYTQEALDTVVDALYAVTEEIYEKQECPDKDCAVHQVVNPSREYCDQKMGEAAKIINGEVKGDVAQARIDYVNWSDAKESYPEYVDEDYCPKKHDNHSIALTFYDKETVLTALGLDGERYAMWVDMTITGFENNENIP